MTDFVKQVKFADKGKYLLKTHYETKIQNNKKTQTLWVWPFILAGDDVVVMTVWERTQQTLSHHLRTWKLLYSPTAVSHSAYSIYLSISRPQQLDRSKCECCMTKMVNFDLELIWLVFLCENWLETSLVTKDLIFLKKILFICVTYTLSTKYILFSVLPLLLIPALL